MRGQVVLGLYEASRAGFVRERVERYCGFIFLFSQRTYFLVFVGLLAVGNTQVETKYSEGMQQTLCKSVQHTHWTSIIAAGPVVYHWYAGMVGIGVLANAVLHLFVRVRTLNFPQLECSRSKCRASRTVLRVVRQGIC